MFLLNVCVYINAYRRAQACKDRRTTFGSQSCPSAFVWILGIEHRLPGWHGKCLYLLSHVSRVSRPGLAFYPATSNLPNTVSFLGTFDILESAVFNMTWVRTQALWRKGVHLICFQIILNVWTFQVMSERMLWDVAYIQQAVTQSMSNHINVDCSRTI